MENQYILKAENISKTFAMEAGFFSKNKKNVYALNDVSFSLPFGKTYGILGESGCGKTTCARVLLQLYKHTSGKIGIKVWVYNGMNYGIEQNEDAGQLVRKPRRDRRSNDKNEVADKAEKSEPSAKARS